MDIKVVFMGSPDFALPTLEALHNNFNVLGVVTQPDRPAGRGRQPQPPDVKVLANVLGLPCIQPASLRDTAAIEQLLDWSPDVIVVAAFGQILREEVLSLPPHGCVNVHASLLPRWRGAAPIQAAILNDDVTGITIMKMDKGLDTGPILRQKVVQIQDTDTAGDLFDELAVVGADLLIETLPSYISGEIVPKPQADDEATYAPRISKEDGALDFSQPAELLARKVRAYYPWPGSFQFFDGARIKVIKAHALSVNCKPGQRYIYGEKPAWGTSDGLLVLDQVQLAGKKQVSGEDFLRGAKNWVELSGVDELINNSYSP